MFESPFSLEESRRWLVFEAARDFFCFQNRGYPRPASLEWVGNRYQLTQAERQVLHRGVFSQADALRRRSKRARGADWRDGWLAVDGHNVQITVESAVLGRPLLQANDGALRDTAGQSSQFRMSEASRLALDMIFRFLEEFRPRRALFLFDAPMSQSGLLAAQYRQRMKALGLRGEARAVPVPEREFPYEAAVIASSDRAVMDASPRWLDLARQVLDAAGFVPTVVDFSPLLLANTTPGGL